MTKSNSREEDQLKEKREQTRMGKVHGGEIVEAISPDELESVNDDTCKHENFTRDTTDTFFNSFTCDNPDCGEVLVYSKI